MDDLRGFHPSERLLAWGRIEGPQEGGGRGVGGGFQGHTISFTFSTETLTSVEARGVEIAPLFGSLVPRCGCGLHPWPKLPFISFRVCLFGFVCLFFQLTGFLPVAAGFPAAVTVKVSN